MIEAARRILSPLRRPRELWPVGRRLSLMLHNRAGEIGVIVSAPGIWLTPAEARAEARRLIQFANLACDPGGMPGELG